MQMPVGFFYYEDKFLSLLSNCIIFLFFIWEIFQRESHMTFLLTYLWQKVFLGKPDKSHLYKFISIKVC